MKVFVMTKKQFGINLLIVALAFLSVLAWGGLGVKASGVSAPRKRLPIYAVNTQEKKIAITLDCAWENSDTKLLLNLFEKYGVKATFFTTGDWCNRYNEDVKEIFSAGHAVENHSYAHPHVAKLERNKLVEDTKKCNAIIKELTGKEPNLYRGPYGEYSNNMLEVIEDEMSMKAIQWDVDSRDWQGKTAEEMASFIIKKATSGSILLFHNDTKNTPQALEMIIPRLQSEGYSFVLVKDLIFNENYTLDHEGRQTKLK